MYMRRSETDPRSTTTFARSSHKLGRVKFDFSSYAAVLLDLDGTIYHEDHPLPGAVELIRLLQAQAQPFACLTNSTSSPQRIVTRLKGMGLALEANHIYTAAAAACDFVVEHLPKKTARPRVFNLATEGVEEMLEGRVDWVRTSDEQCDCIVVGAPANVFATADRQRTALELARGGALVLGICADRVYPSPRGMEFGAGALTKMLAYAAGVEPVFTGKPQELFFRELCRRLAVDPARCLLVGDNLESDVYGAAAVGMRTILVLTGVTRRRDLVAVPKERQPGLVVENLNELRF
jgi:HAD superfamily hydrolase (TIGR01450 family)